MNLREFGSNSKQLLQSIVEKDKTSKSKLSVLGLNCDTERDSLTIKGQCVESDSKPVITKRSMLKFVASFFDSLGLLGPILLNAKSFFQENLDHFKQWDDPLPIELIQKWKELTVQISTSTSFEIPRCVSITNPKDYQLICFVDASPRAYCTTIYLRTIEENSLTIYLIFSRVRLAPHRTVSIPRLELLAALKDMLKRNLHFR